MKWLFDFVTSFFQTLWNGFTWIVDAVGTVFLYSIYFLYDGFLTVILSFISLLDLSALAFNYALSYTSLPPQLIWLANQINIPQGLMIISSALSIRMMLNIVPAAFTRI